MEEPEKKKSNQIRYIIESLEGLSPDIVAVIYRIVVAAESGLE